MGRTKRRRKRKSVATNRPIDTKMIELLQWLGIKTNLQLYNFEDTGRGLRTPQKVSKNELLISIPISKMVTRDYVTKNYKNMPNHWSTQLLLSCFLIIEKSLKQESQWKIYLDTLPEFYSVPYFDVVPTVLCCLPNHLRASVEAQYALIDSKFSEVLKFFPNFEKEIFAWAWFTVNTRGVYFYDKNDNLALAPFLDMFNHKCTVEMEAKNLNNEFYQLRALSGDYAGKFEQIFINYGPHDNFKLYLEYGFVISENPNDCISLSLPDLMNLLNFEEPNLEKIKFIQKYNLDGKLQLTNQSSELVSWSLLAVIYILENPVDMTYRVFDQDLNIINFARQVKTLSENLLHQLETASKKISQKSSVLLQLIEIQIQISRHVLLSCEEL